MRVWDWMILAQATNEWWDYVNAIKQRCTTFSKDLEALKILGA